MTGDIIKDKRIGNAILRRAMQKQKDVMPKGWILYLSQWGYITEACVEDDGDPDGLHSAIYCASFNGVEYKGKLYKSQYFDGCFSPYIVEQ